MRNDWLDLNPAKDACIFRNAVHRCERFDHLIPAYDLIVLNTGAHEQPNMTRSVHDAASFVAMYAHPSAVRVFRNTAPGHVGCNQATAPFTSMEAAEAETRKHPWYDALSRPAQNAIAAELVSKHGFILLDIYRSTVQRPDRHWGGNDCLHYCIPGPVTTWVDMFATLVESAVRHRAYVLT